MIHNSGRKLKTVGKSDPLRGGAYAHHPNSKERRRLLVTVADALTLMLMFGGFVLSLIGLVVVIIQAIVGNQKDRQ